MHRTDIDSQERSVIGRRVIVAMTLAAAVTSGIASVSEDGRVGTARKIVTLDDELITPSALTMNRGDVLEFENDAGQFIRCRASRGRAIGRGWRTKARCYAGVSSAHGGDRPATASPPRSRVTRHSARGAGLTGNPRLSSPVAMSAGRQSPYVVGIEEALAEIRAGRMGP